MMMALHIWSMSHGVASLFARGDAARRKLPMSAEDLLEAEVLIYLRGLGFPTDRKPAAPSGQSAQKPAGPPPVPPAGASPSSGASAAPAGASGPPPGPWGTPK